MKNDIKILTFYSEFQELGRTRRDKWVLTKENPTTHELTYYDDNQQVLGTSEIVHTDKNGYLTYGVVKWTEYGQKLKDKYDQQVRQRQERRLRKYEQQQELINFFNNFNKK